MALIQLCFLRKITLTIIIIMSTPATLLLFHHTNCHKQQCYLVEFNTRSVSYFLVDAEPERSVARGCGKNWISVMGNDAGRPFR